MKKLWRNLRDTYVRKGREKKTTSGQAAKKSKPWKFMETLGFLEDYLDDNMYDISLIHL